MMRTMWWSWTGYAPRAIAAILGMLIVCLASLSYEDEEGRFQNKLEDWWIILDEKRTVSVSWVASFIQAVARLTGSCLDRVFSKRLLSPRVVGVSIILSIASFFLTTSILLAFPIVYIPKIQNSPSAIDAFVLFVRLSAFALLPAISESPHLPWKPWLSRIVIFYWWAMFAWRTLQITPFLLFLFSYSDNGQRIGVTIIGFLAVCLGISLLSDIAFIAFTRWMLRRISKTDRITGILMAILLQIIFLALLFIFPIYLGLKIISSSGFLAFALMLSLFLNSIDVFATVAALIVAVLLLMHRLIWPIIQRSEER